jgi:hypothetical protein
MSTFEIDEHLQALTHPQADPSRKGGRAGCAMLHHLGALGLPERRQ